MDKVCTHCGLAQELDRFPFNKKYQTYRSTCKACRAAALRAYRHDPEHSERLREKERARTKARCSAILAWQKAHPENMRPGQQRRWRRRHARLQEARLAARLAVDTATPITPAANPGRDQQAAVD